MKCGTRHYKTLQDMMSHGFWNSRNLAFCLLVSLTGPSVSPCRAIWSDPLRIPLRNADRKIWVRGNSNDSNPDSAWQLSGPSLWVCLHAQVKQPRWIEVGLSFGFSCVPLLLHLVLQYANYMPIMLILFSQSHVCTAFPKRASEESTSEACVAVPWLMSQVQNGESLQGLTRCWISASKNFPNVRS